MTLAEWKKVFTLKTVEEGIIISKYKAKDIEIEIPSHIGNKRVFAIGNMAFKGKEIETIVIPDTVEIIGERAFCDCKKLKKVVLDKSVLIDSVAFYGCDSLADESGFVIVNHILFRYLGQEKNVAIPEGVIVIDEGAFERCRTIESVSIPASVNTIKNAAFFSCRNLSAVKIENNKIAIHAGAFDACDKLTDADGHIVFGDYLYRCNTNQERVIVPSVVNRIGGQSMSYSTTVKCIVVPEGVTTIEACAFMSCASTLESVELPCTVTSIHAQAFVLCNKLTITAPKDYYAIVYAKEANIPYIEK